MRISHLLAGFVFGMMATVAAGKQEKIPNNLIDYEGFLKDATEVAKLREQRRVTEEAFIQMARDPQTIVLDARSEIGYRQFHIKGAKHLSLADISASELAKIIPEKTTRILIYCNNNFKNDPALITKIDRAAINIYTFNMLYSYGYTNVYELGPVIDVTKTKLAFERPPRT